MSLETLKLLNLNATPAPWTSIIECDSTFNEDYCRLSTSNGRPIGGMDRDNAVWLSTKEAEANPELVLLLRNSASEIISLIEAVEEDIKDNEGITCNCNRPVCQAYQNLISKLQGK